MKRTIAILLAAVMVLAMLACAGKKKEEDKSPMTAEQAIQSATDLLKKAESVHLDLAANMAYSMPEYEYSYDVKGNISTDLHLNPPASKSDVTMTANGETMKGVVYTETEDGVLYTYASEDGGKTWSTGEAELGMDMTVLFNAIIDVLGSVSNAQRTGNETVNGKETTVFTADLSPDVMMKVAKTVNPDMDENSAAYQKALENLKKAKPMKLTLWFADADRSLVRFRLDMLDCMKSMEDTNGMQYSAYDIICDLTYTNVPAITIPEAARESRNAAAIVGTWEMDFEASLAELSEEERSYMEALGVTAASYKLEYTFNADGTGKEHIEAFGMNQDIDFTYTDNNGELTLTATVDGETSSVDLSYTINGNTLTLLSGEETMIFNRK